MLRVVEVAVPQAYCTQRDTRGHRLLLQIRTIPLCEMAEETIAEFSPDAADWDEEAESKLAKQDLETLDITTLTPLSHQIISRQATINIGTWCVTQCLTLRNDWTCSPR